jgi:hypothetical protein
MPPRKQPSHVFAVRQRYKYEQGESLRIAGTFDKAQAIVKETTGIDLDPVTYPDGEWYTIPKDRRRYDEICVERIEIED